jgi:hypothetical protein
VSVVAVPGTAFRRFSGRLAATGTSRTCAASSLVFVSRGRLPLRRRQGEECNKDSAHDIGVKAVPDMCVAGADIREIFQHHLARVREKLAKIHLSVSLRA